MKVMVELTDRDWWHLSGVAERRGIKVQDMLRASIAQVTAMAATPADTVRMFVEAGLPDGEISRRTGMTVATVAGQRRRMGLRPNRRAVWEAKQRAALAAKDERTA